MVILFFCHNRFGLGVPTFGRRHQSRRVDHFNQRWLSVLLRELLHRM